jgi:small-conductance mechanosensitive channel
VDSLKVLDAVPGWFHGLLLQFYTLIVSLIVVYLAYRVFRTVFIPLGEEYASRRKTRIDQTVLSAVDLLGGVVIVVLGLFWVLSRQGIDVTVFLAGLGVAGLVLAFALQDTLSNFFSGLHLMMDRPFTVGDTLEINGEFMEVLRVGFRSTRLYNIFAHEVVIMPNNMIANQMVVNVTKPDLEYRVSVEVGVAYGSPVEQVKEILFEAVRGQEEVILDDEDKRPRVSFTDFGDSALQFRVRFFVKDVLEQWSVMTAVREHIDRRFREEGITIPFPQRTLSFLPQGEGEALRLATEGGVAPAAMMDPAV